MELVCRLYGVKRLEQVIPLKLTWCAFAVHQQLRYEEKADADKIKTALYKAFAMDETSSQQFISCWMQPDKSVDVYLSKLRKLVVLFEAVSDRTLG